MRPIRLQTWLIRLLTAAGVLPFLLIGGATLLYRLPQIEADVRVELQDRADAVSRLLDHFTRSVEAQLIPLATLSGLRSATEIQDYLDALVSEGSVFNAVFLVTPEGKIQGIGLPRHQRSVARELRGMDFSHNRLFSESRQAGSPNTQARALWSDRYLSALLGKNTVGVAITVGDHILIGEASLERILEILADSTHTAGSLVTIVDGRGQWMASSNKSAPGKHLNYAALPTFNAVVSGQELPAYETFQDKPRLVGGVLSDKLNWIIIATAPAGWDDPNYRITVLLVAAGVLGSLFISLLLAPLGASRLSALIQPMIDKSQRISAGDYPSTSTPPGAIVEFNRLSEDLNQMARAIQAREAALRDNQQKLENIFNASPVAMSVSDANRHFSLVSANAAWEKQFKRSLRDVTGLNGEQMGLWVDLADRDRMLAELHAGHIIEGMEAQLLTGDGQRILTRISAHITQIGNERLLLMISVDITEQRRIENRIRNLNNELEERVALRTEELSQTNEELETTVENLRATQQQLVESEKIAALGGLVAGVAHELSTPVGNALLATSTLGNLLQEFQAARRDGLRRSDLENFVSIVESSCEITERNLHRAADLLRSFKQVAVDQSSDQRREFDLYEAVQEIVLTLQPTLKRTPFLIENAIPKGFVLDSYPGALGQVITNLISNAVIHGFEGRSHGTIRIEATNEAENQVRITLSDDGCGIPPEAQKRIFDPFFTTKLGRGGSGLGLHICHNAVTHILGGKITLQSEPGQGCAFSLLIPTEAPVRQQKNSGGAENR